MPAASNQCTEEQVLQLARRLFSYDSETETGIVCGIGDDAAVLTTADPLLFELITVDALVSGTHFESGTPAGQVAWKAIAVNVSDIAAMGGVPTYALVAATVPASLPAAYLVELLEGIKQAAAAFNVSVIGGDTVGGPALSLSITMTGYVERELVCYRSGAQAGDIIAVTGPLGGSLRSGRHLNVQPRLREARWLVRHARPRAMMDLSDGLAKDGTRMAAAGTVRLCIDSAALPISEGSSLEGACRDGEDFELLCVFDPKVLNREAQEAYAAACGRPIHIIGTVRDGTPGVLLDGRELEPQGFEHFEL